MKVDFSAALRRREVNLGVLIIVLVIAVTIRAPHFLTWSNFGKIFEDTGILVIVAIAQLFVIVTEGIDLSVASVMGLTGMIVGVINLNAPGIPMIVHSSRLATSRPSSRRWAP